MAVIHKFNPRGLRFPMTAMILAVTVGVTLVQFVADGLGDHGGPVSARLALFLPSLWSGEWWRLFTVGLVHGDPWHILMNGMSLWVVCSIYEVIAGSRRMLLVYLLSLIGGSAAVALLGQVFTPVVGASGAIFGVFGAVIAHVYSKFGSVKMMWEVPYTRQLLIVLALNIAVSFVPGISLLGHAGGLLSGFIAGYLTERQLSKRLAPGEKIGAVVFGIALMAAAIYGAHPIHRGGFMLFQAADELGLEWDVEIQSWHDTQSKLWVHPASGLLGTPRVTDGSLIEWSLKGMETLPHGFQLSDDAQRKLVAAAKDNDGSELYHTASYSIQLLLENSADVDTALKRFAAMVTGSGAKTGSDSKSVAPPDKTAPAETKSAPAKS